MRYSLRHDFVDGGAENLIAEIDGSIGCGRWAKDVEVDVVTA